MGIRHVVLLAFLFALQLAFMTHYARPAVSVDLHPKIGLAGGDLRVRYRVEPDEANRLLRMILDNGGSFYRASDETLDGADAPITRTVWYGALPAGRYQVAAIVARENGKTRRAYAEVCFAGPGIEC